MSRDAGPEDVNTAADRVTDPALRSQLDRLLAQVAAHAPIRTAIVHPCDAVSLGGAMEAARRRLIVPVLIGPAAKIAAAAAQAGEDLTGVEIVATAHSHAAAEAACRLARTGAVGAIIRKLPLNKASISFKGKDWTVPRAFQGEHLAIRPQAKDGTFGIYFGANLIKTIDLNP